MDKLIDFLGRDTFIIAVLFIAVNIRAGKPEKVSAIDGLISAFTPFFIVICILYLAEWGFSWFGLVIPALPLAAMGGLGGYLGNSWVLGLQKDGKDIEEKGALSAMGTLIKSVINFKKGN